MVTQHGAIISSNGRSKIKVAQITDQFLVPDYPATSDQGIAHFIHCENPIRGDADGPSVVREACARIMSKVT